MGYPDISYTYEPFSREPEYVQANREFVKRLDPARCGRLLDLACGTGTISELVREVRPDLPLVGLDISEESLNLARAHFADGRYGPPLALVSGSADGLPFRDGMFDGVVMANSIHNLRDTDTLLCEVARVLTRNGVFGFNTSFYAGTFVPGTERFYHEWMRAALAHIAARGTAGGEERRRRKRGNSPRAFTNRWRRPAEWAEMLERRGFRRIAVHERTVIMRQRSFEMVGAYAGLAEVLLSGYPVRLACDALQAAVEPALAAVGATEIPRLWLEVTGEKAEAGR